MTKPFTFYFSTVMCVSSTLLCFFFQIYSTNWEIDYWVLRRCTFFIIIITTYLIFILFYFFLYLKTHFAVVNAFPAVLFRVYAPSYSIGWKLYVCIYIIRMYIDRCTSIVGFVKVAKFPLFFEKSQGGEKK